MMTQKNVKKPLPAEEYEEGQVPDDSPQQRPSPSSPQIPAVDQPEKDPSPSSSEIVFQTTDVNLHSEKRRKKIHKQNKDKRMEISHREKQREKRVQRSNPGIKLNLQREPQPLPEMFPPFMNQINPQSHSFFVPSHAAYYPQFYYPLPPQARNGPPMTSFYPFPPQQQYIPPLIGNPPPMGNPYTYNVSPIKITQQHDLSQFQGGPQPNLGNQHNNNQGNQHNKSQTNSGFIEARGPFINNDYQRKNRFAHTAERQRKEQTQRRDQNKVSWTNSGAPNARQEEKQQNQYEGIKGVSQRQKGGDRKRNVQEEVKNVVRKQLKCFSPQEQLTILQIVKCLIKYCDRAVELTESQQSIRKTVYLRSIEAIQQFGKGNAEKKQNLNRILEAVHLEVASCSLKENKLYSWAMKDHNFVKIIQKLDGIVKTSFEQLQT